MSDRLTLSLRLFAAVLLAGSGVAHVASLWFRELDEQAVAALFLGAVYLVIAIGLFGQSRFTLFVAIAVPGTLAIASLQGDPTSSAWQTANAVCSLAVAGMSLLVLWQVRKRPSQ